MTKVLYKIRKCITGKFLLIRMITPVEAKEGFSRQSLYTVFGFG